MNDRELVDRIIAVITQEAGLKKPAALLERTGTGAERYVCKFRDDAIYLAREHTKAGGLAWETLALWFGKRHHTTLLGAHRRVMLRLQGNPPRRDGRKWADWHKYIIDRVYEKGESK